MSSELPSQLDRLRETDWDVLLVLDALRWDYWDALVGEGEPVKTGGSCTLEWISWLLRHTDFSDVSCITANPEVTRRAHESLFLTRYDLWRDGWEEISGIGTVPPHKVSTAVETEVRLGPDKRVYGHYAQPHGPYPVHEPPIPVMRNNPEADDVDREEEYMPEKIIMNPNDLLNDEDAWLTPEILRDAYKSNLEWVWDSVKDVVQMDATVVVTADHGEFLGETVQTALSDEDKMHFYGHPCGFDHEILRKVPFAVYD